MLILAGNRLRLGATQFILLHVLSASCGRKYDVNRDCGDFLLVERAAQRKVASRAMGRPAAYLRFEIRVMLVRPQPQHVPL